MSAPKFIYWIFVIVYAVSFSTFDNGSYVYDSTVADNYELFGPFHIIGTMLCLLGLVFSMFDWNSNGKKIFYIIIIPLTIFLGGCYTYILTNYYFFDEQSKREVTVKVHWKDIPFRQDRTNDYNVELRFDNGNSVKINSEKLYNSVERGDSVKIYVYDGYWGIPVVR